MKKFCAQCTKEFEVTHQDREFYKKIDVPDPTLCPDCRLQQRWCWRSERVLYPRTCDLCKKSTVSVFSSNSGYIVYCPDCWWGDGYDPLAYGRSYDSARSFFEQFDELNKAVPKLAIIPCQVI